MICMLKTLARRSLAACGMYNLARNLSAHLPRIIMYHSFCGPQEDVPSRMPVYLFRRQLEYIKKHYRTWKLCDLAAARLRDGVYPRRAVVITVDDGYANFYRLAFPLLRELEIPATLFVITKFLNGQAWMWTDQFKYLCEHAQGVLALKEEKQPALLRALKRLPVAERELLLSALAREADVSIPSEAPPEYELMSWEQLREVADSGLIEIGSHTRTHTILAQLNAEDSWEELHTSRLEIQDRLGVPVQSFCYPNGMPGDYRPDQVEMLCRAGYQCATASHFGYDTGQSNIFTLPRIGSISRDINLFLKYLDGVEYFQRRVLGSL